MGINLKSRKVHHLWIPPEFSIIPHKTFSLSTTLPLPSHNFTYSFFRSSFFFYHPFYFHLPYGFFSFRLCTFFLPCVIPVCRTRLGPVEATGVRVERQYFSTRGESKRDKERKRPGLLSTMSNHEHGKGERGGGVVNCHESTPARTLNLLNVLARAWNASISLFYFGSFALHSPAKLHSPLYI